MSRASQEFDEELFTLKISEPARQMEIECEASDKAAFQGASGPAKLGGSVLIRIVDGRLAVLRKFLETVDRICREVWQTQGETITPEFVRKTLVPKAITTIGARVGVINECVDNIAGRTHQDPHAAWDGLAMKVNRLKAEMNKRYEIEARELEYKQAQGVQGAPQSHLDELGGIPGLIGDAERDTVLWLQANPSAEERGHVLAMQERLADLDRIIARRVERRSLPNDGRQWSETVGEVLSRLDKAREVRGNIVGKGLARLADHLPKGLPAKKAPKPRLPEPVRTVNTSGSLFVSQAPAKATHRPPSPPIYFPSDLWPQTVVILDEACKRFPDQSKTLELCKYVISRMTPVFCGAVKAGKMKAGAVLAEWQGGMEDLLHSLLVYNSDHDEERFLRAQETRNSEEYRELAKAIAGVSAKPSADTAEGKSTNAADGAKVRIGQNIDKLRKECGWSLDKLAEKTGIDKKAILTHVHGKSRPNPSTQKEYAQAFTKELHRPITANNLEE